MPNKSSRLESKRVLALASLGAIAMTCADRVAAQEIEPDAPEATPASHSDDRGYDEAIIVTATRREQRLQDVPMSLNVFSGNSLEESGVETLQDLQQIAAGVHIKNELGQARVTIRGIGSNQFSIGGDSGAAVHRDGVYLASQLDQALSFFDIERIEVMRGPQGTLYGRNATGGTINVITNSPTESFEAGGQASFGNYGLVQTEGHVSGPVVAGGPSVRVAFRTRDHTGYTTNVFDGSRLNNEDSVAVRAKILYEPVSNWRIEFAGDYARDDGTSVFHTARGESGAPLTFEASGGFLPQGRQVNSNDPQRNYRETWGVGARAQWDLGAVLVSSLTSYREIDWRYSYDADGGATSLVVVDPEIRRSNQLSQEVTLISDISGPITFAAGAFYFSSREEQTLRILLPTIPLTISNSVDPLRTDAYAIFGELGYQVAERVKLILGGRYSYEKRSINQSVGASIEQLSDHWEDFSPKVAVTYVLTDNLNVYATVAKGFKAGGFNANVVQGQSYKPETVYNYEVGMKGVFVDGKVRLNVAAFHMDYRDLQVQVLRTNPITNLSVGAIDNAATSIIQGLELEAQVQPTSQVTVYGNISYLDATFDLWPDAIDSTRGGAEFDVSGNRLPNAPEWAANLGVSYEIPLGSAGAVMLHGDYSYRGRVYFTPFESGFVSEGGYSWLNARISFRTSDNRWSVAAWMNNITDEVVTSHLIQSASGISGRPSFSYYLPPRTYGMTVGFNF